MEQPQCSSFHGYPTCFDVPTNSWQPLCEGACSVEVVTRPPVIYLKKHDGAVRSCLRNYVTVRSNIEWVNLIESISIFNNGEYSGQLCLFMPQPREIWGSLFLPFFSQCFVVVN